MSEWYYQNTRIHQRSRFERNLVKSVDSKGLARELCVCVFSGAKSNSLIAKTTVQMALEWATFLYIELTISNHLSQCLLFLCHFKSLVALESASIWNGKWKTYVRRQTEAICECEGERTAKAERKQRKHWQPVFRSVRCMSTWMDVCVVMAMMVVIFPFFFSNGFARHAINRSSNSGRCVKRKRNCLYFVARKLKSNTESNETYTPLNVTLCPSQNSLFS